MHPTCRRCATRGNSYINTEAPPASTLVVVKQLVREEYLIEVEAIAVAAE